jgi:GMP reductase
MKFDYDDINLVPKKCIVGSRSECDTSVKFGKYTFKLPIVPANMECVINEDLCLKLAKSGYFYIMHRFNIDIISFIKKMNISNIFSSISIGVNDDSYRLIDIMTQLQVFPDYITIDIAHGHSVKMENMIKYIKSKLPNTFVIAGNVSTQEAVIDLQNWGADSIKCGIGPGSSCTTYPATGFGSRNCQAYIISECFKVAKVPIIADGGIKVPGDISKSLALGASMIMIGGMLSGFADSPGDIIIQNDIKYKSFWGSSSSFQSGKANRIEGKKNIVVLKDKTLMEEMLYLEECIQSSISYSGGNNIESLKNVKYI